MCSGISGQGDSEGHVGDNIYKVTLLCVQESLDEVTVKDMLEGDNMYTCSKCQKKVRAEKRYTTVCTTLFIYCQMSRYFHDH